MALEYFAFVNVFFNWVAAGTTSVEIISATDRANLEGFLISVGQRNPGSRDPSSTVPMGVLPTPGVTAKDVGYLAVINQIQANQSASSTLGADHMAKLVDGILGVQKQAGWKGRHAGDVRIARLRIALHLWLQAYLDLPTH